MGMTAAEIVEELNKDPKHVAMKAEKEAKFAKLKEMYDADQRELVLELNELGFNVTSVWDFVNAPNNYFKAGPTLLKHLNSAHHPRIVDGIARSLANKEFIENEEIWLALLKHYSDTLPDEKKTIPEERGTQQGISAALTELATKERLPSLRSLIEQNPNGDAVDWLIKKVKELE